MNYLQIEQEHEENFKRKVLDEQENKNEIIIRALKLRISELEIQNKALQMLMESKFGK